MKLAELIDLESQILRDYDADPTELRRRDRKIGQELLGRKLSRLELLLSWLQRVQTWQSSSPGQILATGFRWLGYALILLGLLAGVSAAKSVLAYDGTHPVNIIHFLAVMVALQVLTLIFFVLNALPQPVRKFVPGIGHFYQLIRELGYLVSRWAGKASKYLQPNKSELWADLQRLKVRQKLYERIEKWLMVTLTQRFGLAFNIGTLLTCLYLITFSDLAFAWSTTLDIRTESFHRLLGLVSLPWSGLFPQGVPSAQLVHASRYFRLEGEYLDAALNANQPNAIFVGQWWTFLVLAVLFYGLVPRLIIFIIANLKLKYAIARFPLKNADFESLFDRLNRPLVETRALESDETEDNKKNGPGPSFTLAGAGTTCTAVKWGDLEIPDTELEQLIRRRFGWQVKAMLSAGSFDYDASTRTAIDAIASRKNTELIVLLAESWEPPDIGVTNFLQTVRQRSPIDRPIVVALVNTVVVDHFGPPRTEDWRTWQKQLAFLADPFLRVEALVKVS